MRFRILILILLALVFTVGIFYSLTVFKNSAKDGTTSKVLKKRNMKQLTITSSAFTDKGKIPSKYTCDGEDINPPLDFGNVPEDTHSLVLIVEDPDAPGKTWLHWLVFNIAPHATHISEDSVPEDGVEAVTDFGHKGYGGPCPPSGIHRYNFKLYALDTTLDSTEDVTKEEIESAMEGHIIDMAELTGLYSRD